MMKKLIIVSFLIAIVFNSFAQSSISITGPASGSNFNTMLGVGVPAITSGSNNTFLGYFAGAANTTGTDNTFTGIAGYRNTTGISNTFTGSNAGSVNTTGSYNTSNGTGAGAYNNGSGNVFLGAATSHYTTGNNNVVAGSHAGYQYHGDGNVILGNGAVGGYPGTNLQGNRNIFIGQNSYATVSGLSNAIAIGYNSKISQSNSMSLGGVGTDAVKVGIGTDAPSANLDVLGSLRFRGLLQNNANTRIMTTDANGNIAWRDAASLVPTTPLGWSLSGNSLTGKEFIGSTNAADVVFKANNAVAGKFLAAGGFVFGPTSSVVTGGTTSAAGGDGSQASRYCGFAFGQGAKALGDKSVALGWNITLNGHNTYSIGSANSSAAGIEYTGTFGVGLNAAATSSYLIGGKPGNSLTNSIPNSLMIGFKSTPTLLVTETSVAVNTTTPTAAFHVNCASAANVRFENLPQGTGNILVIDANGYVRRSTVSALTGGGGNGSKDAQIINEQQERIKALESRLEKLEALLTKALPQETPLTEAVELNQNFPNPTNGFTTIDYVIPASFNNTTMSITDVNGKLVKEIKLTEHKGSVTIDSSTMIHGTYIYSIKSDGKLLSSKKMMKQE
jgi:hypothetical protein